MSELDQRTRLPEDFDGRVRLFPLPGLVVFPHALQPLHIFEPRYCELLAESLASDKLITMALPTEPVPSTEPAPLTELASSTEPVLPPETGRPALESVVCICKVISHVPTEDNRHNVLLLGAQRARILREFDTQRSFRMAEVEVLPDVYPPNGASGRAALQTRLLAAFKALIPAAGEVHKNLHQLMASQMMLGPITDIIAYTLQFDSRAKVRLLGEPSVDQRAEALTAILERQVAEEAAADVALEGGFPPPFSRN